MKTIDLTTERAGIEDVLHLAEGQNLLVRRTDGKVFVVAEVDAADVADDFADEVARTRHNQTLRALLAERSNEPGKYTTEQVREMLGLTASAE